MTADLVAQALAALRQKDFETARDRIVAFEQNHKLELQHYLIKGLSEIALAEWPHAQHTFAMATRAFPFQAQLWVNLGLALENCGHIDEAVAALEHAIELDAKQADAYGNLSHLYRRQRRYKAAEDMAHAAFERGADKAQSLNALGLAKAKQGDMEAAQKVFLEARQWAPRDPIILVNLANLLVDQLKFDEAWPLFSAARQIKDLPVIKRDEGMARLLSGDFRAGWTLYEARIEVAGALRYRSPAPRWMGEPLFGKTILLVAEQGFGDTLQFCRFGHILEKAGAKLVWIVAPPLLRLLKDNLGGTVLSAVDDVPPTDYWLPIMSLPFALARYTSEDAPSPPYLKAPPEPSLPATGDGLKIGLVWAGSRTHERDEERSLSLDHLKLLFDEVKARYHAIFKGDAIQDITATTPVMSLETEIEDFADTAALIMQLDLVVTVDTAVAHLAGALGKTAYLLLPFCPDWRWGLNSSSTGWYPSLHLLRQTARGDWGSVIRQLTRALVEKKTF